MANNLNFVPTVAGSIPVTPEPTPQFFMSTLTLGLTLNQPLIILIPVNHNEKPEKFSILNLRPGSKKRCSTCMHNFLTI